MKKINHKEILRLLALFALLVGVVIRTVHGAQDSIKLSDKQIEELVRRSYQYVAMCNVNQKMALDEEGMAILLKLQKNLMKSTLTKKIRANLYSTFF